MFSWLTPKVIRWKANPSQLSIPSHVTGDLTAKELAALLRVSVRLIYRAIETDNLPVIRIGSSIRFTLRTGSGHDK